jgi:hypothetical protein
MKRSFLIAWKVLLEGLSTSNIQFGGLLGGGGLMNDNGTMTMADCTISNNQELDGNGGGGVLNDNGTMTITGCTISNNSARRSGMDESSGSLEKAGGVGIRNARVVVWKLETPRSEIG